VSATRDIVRYVVSRVKDRDRWYPATRWAVKRITITLGDKGVEIEEETWASTKESADRIADTLNVAQAAVEAREYAS
jgi:hypothetical protein